MAAQPLHAEEESNGSFELCRQEEDLEVEEGLLVHREVGLAWGEETKLTQESDDRQPRPRAEGLAGRVKRPWQTQWAAMGTTTWLCNLLQPSQHNRQVGSCCKTQTACTRWERNRVQDLQMLHERGCLSPLS